MTRKETLQVIRCLLIENGNVIDKEIIRLAFAHNISLSVVRNINGKSMVAGKN